MEHLIKNFVCQGGEYTVEISDKKAIELVNEIDFMVEITKSVRNRYGDKPEHPYDYCEIAGMLYINGFFSRSDWEYLENYMLHNCMYRQNC